MRGKLATVGQVALLGIGGIFNFGWIVYPPLGNLAGLCGALALVAYIVAVCLGRPSPED